MYNGTVTGNGKTVWHAQRGGQRRTTKGPTLPKVRRDTTIVPNPRLAPHRGLWHGPRRSRTCPLSRSCCRSSGVEHSLGKGEAEGSIPSGSTIFPTGKVDDEPPRVSAPAPPHPSGTNWSVEREGGLMRLSYQPPGTKSTARTKPNRRLRRPARHLRQELQQTC